MGCCERDNELSCSVKGGEFCDQLSDYELLSMDSDPWNYCVLPLVHILLT
jgi:hypothetical protein